MLLGGFGLIAWRRESLRAEATFDTPLSRESVFLGNNILLLVLTFTVLVGTIYPLLAEAVTGGKVSVGSPFFNRNTVPVALLLLFLMGIGPLLPWRAASLSAVLRRLQVPMWAAAAPRAARADRRGRGGGVRVRARGVRRDGDRRRDGPRRAGAAAGARALRPRAAVAAISRNHRLYGGLVVHLGLIVAVVGVSWAALSIAPRRSRSPRARSSTRRATTSASTG